MGRFFEEGLLGKTSSMAPRFLETIGLGLGGYHSQEVQYQRKRAPGLLLALFDPALPALGGLFNDVGDLRWILAIVCCSSAMSSNHAASTAGA